MQAICYISHHVKSFSVSVFSLVNNVVTFLHSFMHANVTYPYKKVISGVITITERSIFFFYPLFSARVQRFISNQGLISHLSGLPALICNQCN